MLHEVVELALRRQQYQPKEYNKAWRKYEEELPIGQVGDDVEDAHTSEGNDRQSK